jgi:hypothetical protein
MSSNQLILIDFRNIQSGGNKVFEQQRRRNSDDGKGVDLK